MFDSARRGVPPSDTTLLRVRLLGNMEARSLVGESLLPVGGKTRGLLAILALADRRPVSRAQLATLLWSRRPDDLARASLRQEIHRLLSALGPFGVDIIDVQRHALTLKPALTSVDVERLYAGGLAVLDELEFPLKPLLHDLGTIDPAFDLWREEHAARIVKHVEKVLIAAVQEQSDPAIRLQAAERLLTLDACSEPGWRGRIEATLAQGDETKALLHAEEALRFFQSRTGQPPGPATLRVIEALRARRPNAGERLETPLLDTPSATLGEILLPPTLPTVATLMALSIESPDPAFAPAVEAILDGLDEMLVTHQFLRIIPPPEQPGTMQDELSFARKAGAQFVLRGMLRIGASGARFVTRLLEVSRDVPTIVWAASIDLPDATVIAAQVEMRRRVRPLVEALCWAVLQHEGRRNASRPARELNAGGLVLRALMLTLRCDNRLINEIEMLLSRAARLDAESPLFCFVSALFELGRVTIFLQDDETGGMERLLSAIQRYQLVSPENSWALLLMAMQFLLTPGQTDKAAIFMDIHRQRIAGGQEPNVPLGAVMDAIMALRDGRKDVAVEVLASYIAMRHEIPVAVLSDATAALLLFLVGQAEEARRLITLVVGLYPRNTLALVYRLAMEAAIDSPSTTEARMQLRRTSPELGVERILATHAFLPDADLAWLSDSLRKAGLPEKAEAGLVGAVIVETGPLGGAGASGYVG